MAVRKKSSDTANLDSFLDTLFNVAGILVIIIALTQITAKEKIKTAVETEQSGSVTKQQVAKAEKELEQLTRNFLAGQVAYRSKDRELAGLKNNFANLQTNYGRIKSEILSVGPYTPPSVLQGNVNELKKEADDLNQTAKNTGVSLELVRSFKDWSQLRSRLLAAKEKLDGNKTEFTDLTDLLANRKKNEAASRENIANLTRGKVAMEQEGKLRDLVEEKNAKDEEISSLNTKLKKIKGDLNRLSQLPKDIRIPDPRDPTEGLIRKDFIIKGGEIWNANQASPLWDPWREKYKKWLEPYITSTVLARLRLNIATPKEDEWQPILNRGLKTAWRNGDLQGPILRNRQFEIDLSNFPISGAEVRPRKGTGTPLEDAFDVNSEFIRIINRMPNRKGVVYFWVWEDSFEWYFRFQKFAEEKGFENGWTPMAQDSTLTFGGGGGGPVQ